MTQALEKLSTNVYVLWVAIIFAGGSGWATCAYLGGIASQIGDVSHKVDMTNSKVQDLAETTERNQEWIKSIDSKVSDHERQLDRIIAAQDAARDAANASAAREKRFENSQ